MKRRIRKSKTSAVVIMAFLVLALSACSLGSKDSSVGGDEGQEARWATAIEDNARTNIQVSEAKTVEGGAGTALNTGGQNTEGQIIGEQNVVVQNVSGQNAEGTKVDAQAAAPASGGEGAQVVTGYQYGMDGQNILVTVSFDVKDVVRGEEAKQALSGLEVPLPGEGEEYIVITLNVTYLDGDDDSLFLTENVSSLPSANLCFSMPNGESNAVNLTMYLDGSIHDCEIRKGESAEGKVAFIHRATENGPLIFHGFDNIVELDI